MRKVTPSELLVYEECPRKWFYSYKAKPTFRGKRSAPHAFSLFSSAMHSTIGQYLLYREPPIEIFEEKWQKYRHYDPESLVYKKHETWQTLNLLGRFLIVEFMASCMKYIRQGGTDVLFVEKNIEYHDPHGIYLLKTRPDVLCMGHDGAIIILEIKNTETPCNPLWVYGSDQLTAYAMAVEQYLEYDLAVNPIKVLLCNLHKCQEGISWTWGERNLMSKAQYHSKIKRFLEDTGNVVSAEDTQRRTLYAWSSPCNVCNFTEPCYSITTQKSNDVPDIIFDNIANPFL